MDSLSRRDAVALALLAAAMIATGLRGVLGDPTGLVLGNTTDAIHAAWAHWWMAQPGGEGELTRLVSFPSGEVGSVVAPLGTRLLSPLARAFGAPVAHSSLTAAYLAFDAAAVLACVRQLTGSARAGVVAAFSLLAARPVFVQAGMGAIDGVAVGWVPLAIAIAARGGRFAGLSVGALLAVAVVENPYAIAVAPVVAVVLAARMGARPGGIWQIALALGSGAALTALRLAQVGEGLGGNIAVTETLTIFGRKWTGVKVDHVLPLLDYVLPSDLPSLDARAWEVLGTGGIGFLGLVTLALATWGALRGGRAAWIALALALACALLSVGPRLWTGGPAGPFFWLDVLLAGHLHPLSQPSRFSAFVAAAAAVAAGIGYSRLRLPRAFPIALAGLVAEGLLHGGPAIPVPVTSLRPFACLDELDPGAVHVFAGDAAGTQAWGDAALVLQLVHQQPGTHPGLGGWARRPADKWLAADLQALAHLDPADRDARQRLARVIGGKHVRWLVVKDDHPLAPIRAVSCGGWAAVDIPGLRP